MTLAFQAVVLFLLALPGLSFRFFYRRGHSSTPPLRRVIGDEIALGLVVAVVVHAIWVCGAGLLSFTPNVDLEAVFSMVSGKYGDKEADFDRVRSSVTQHTPWLLLYFSTATLAAGAAGYFIRGEIRRRELDCRYPLLRTNTEWADLLAGRTLQYHEVNSKRGLPDAVFVSAIAELGGTAYLYVGFVRLFYCNDQGELERIVLQRACRRELSADRDRTDKPKATFSEDYYRVTGDFFVLRYSEVKTLNVDYLWIAKA